MKKILHFSILTLITLCFNGCFWGWGWLVPYSFQPSYHKFKKMCKLNELPNDEYKYNKILGYFDTSLESLDWEYLNKRKWKLKKQGHYRQGVYEYETLTQKKEINSRLRIIASFLSNESEMNPYNINQMSIDAYWHTKRFYLDGNEGTGAYWSKIEVTCADIVKDNMTPKGLNNE